MTKSIWIQRGRSIITNLPFLGIALQFLSSVADNSAVVARRQRAGPIPNIRAAKMEKIGQGKLPDLLELEVVTGPVAGVKFDKCKRRMKVVSLTPNMGLLG